MNYRFTQSLGRLTKDISYTIGKLLEQYFLKAGYEITPLEWVILTYLYNKGMLNQVQLAEFSGRDKVSIKRAVDQLEAKQWVTRTKDSQDRRYNQVRLTEYGLRHFPELEKRAGKVLEVAYNGVPEGEVQQALSTLDRFLHNINEALYTHKQGN